MGRDSPNFMENANPCLDSPKIHHAIGIPMPIAPDPLIAAQMPNSPVHVLSGNLNPLAHYMQSRVPMTGFLGGPMMFSSPHGLSNGFLGSHLAGIHGNQGHNPFTAALIANATETSRENGSVDMRKSSIDSLRTKAKEYSSYEISHREVETP